MMILISKVEKVDCLDLFLMKKRGEGCRLAEDEVDGQGENDR